MFQNRRSQRVRNIRTKTPVLGPLFNKHFLIFYKEIATQIFSCKHCKHCKNFQDQLFYRTPPVAASTGSLEKRCSEKFRKLQQSVSLPEPFLIKLQTYNLQLCENRGSGTGVLLWILWNFSEQFYAEQLWTTAPGC